MLLLRVLVPEPLLSPVSLALLVMLLSSLLLLAMSSVLLPEVTEEEQDLNDGNRTADLGRPPAILAASECGIVSQTTFCVNLMLKCSEKKCRQQCVSL